MAAVWRLVLPEARHRDALCGTGPRVPVPVQADDALSAGARRMHLPARHVVELAVATGRVLGAGALHEHARQVAPRVSTVHLLHLTQPLHECEQYVGGLEEHQPLALPQVGDFEPDHLGAPAHEHASEVDEDRLWPPRTLPLLPVHPIAITIEAVVVVRELHFGGDLEAQLLQVGPAALDGDLEGLERCVHVRAPGHHGDRVPRLPLFSELPRLETVVVDADRSVVVGFRVWARFSQLNPPDTANTKRVAVTLFFITAALFCQK